jgi:hypothetical protein
METAKANAINFEFVKLRTVQAKEGGWLITIRTHPNDSVNELALAPSGQRGAAAIVLLKDAE